MKEVRHIIWGEPYLPNNPNLEIIFGYGWYLLEFLQKQGREANLPKERRNRYEKANI